jgi:hypothetical protein
VEETSELAEDDPALFEIKCGLVLAIAELELLTADEPESVQRSLVPRFPQAY